MLYMLKSHRCHLKKSLNKVSNKDDSEVFLKIRKKRIKLIYVYMD